MTTALVAHSRRVASSASRTRLARRTSVALRRFWYAYWDLQVRHAVVAMQGLDDRTLVEFGADRRVIDAMVCDKAGAARQRPGLNGAAIPT
jgi:hypothetical protein